MRLRHRPSRVKWICATTAPWALAIGLLVSFTAAANNSLQGGMSGLGRSAAPRLLDRASLVPFSAASLPFSDVKARTLSAGLDLQLSQESFSLLGSVPLHDDLKADPPAYPRIDRSGKSDPISPAKPSLSRRASEAQFRSRGAGLILSRDQKLLPPTVLMEGKVEGPDMDQGFEPWASPDFMTTRQTTSLQSPAAAAAGSTGAAASTATPSVARATVLSSATPAPAEATPTEIAAAPVSLPQRGGMSVATRNDPDRPRYADLVSADNLSKEQRCLAEAIYFEARSEPEEGQAAVAQVVLNRVRSGLYPSSICGVVYQNRHRHLACQFTFACEGKALRTTETEPWESARRIAREVLEGKTYLADVGGATHYHADYVRPYWAKRLKKMDVIGRHIFYQLRPGQT